MKKLVFAAVLSLAASMSNPAFGQDQFKLTTEIFFRVKFLNPQYKDSLVKNYGKYLSPKVGDTILLMTRSDLNDWAPAPVKGKTNYVDPITKDTSFSFISDGKNISVVYAKAVVLEWMAKRKRTIIQDSTVRGSEPPKKKTHAVSPKPQAVIGDPVTIVHDPAMDQLFSQKNKMDSNSRVLELMLRQNDSINKASPRQFTRPPGPSLRDLINKK